jgi:CheY-like chemotaxis protein
MPQVILFLDDNPARHALMDEWNPLDTIIHVYNIHDFRTALEECEKFDVVSLDHDLNDFTELGVKHRSVMSFGEATGRDACGYMMKYLHKLPPEIIIHSSNETGARSMMDFLDSRQISYRWKMFNDGKKLDNDEIY